jgi:PAS domain S-box-containing protein
MNYAGFTLNILQNLSLVLLIIFIVPPRLFFALQSRNRILANLGLGLVLGLVGWIIVLVPAPITPDLSIDSRVVIIVLSVIFGGWPAGLLITLMICIFHLLQGGPNLGLDLLTTLGSLALGGLFYQFIPTLKRQRAPVYLILGAAVALVTAAWIAIIPLSTVVYRLQVALPVGLLYGLFTFGLVGLFAAEMEHAREDENREQLARAVRIIRECDQALIKASDETSLLEQICQIIVRNSRYMMVWVGYPEQDEALSIRPVVSAGYGIDYAHQIQVSWGDNPLGRGPIGQASRSHRFALCSDTYSDPNFAPWREEAHRRGYASVLALPLLHQDNLLGVLTLYASHRYAFDPEEITLLQDLVNDLAYGLASLRLRAETGRVQSALEQSELQLASIFRASPEAIMISTLLEGRLLAVNDGFVRITGFQPEEVIGFTTTEKTMWFNPSERTRLLRELRQKGAVFNFEFQFRKKDGQIIPLLTQFMPVRYQDQNCLLMMGTDISEIKKAGEALRLSEATFRMLINSTDDTVLLIDLQGHVLEANNGIMAQMGVDHETLLGSMVYDYFSPEIARSRREKAQEVVGLQHSVRFEDHNNQVWEEQIISPVYNDHNEVVSLAIVSRNITERKKSEEILRRSEEAYRLLAATLEQRVSERTRELEVLYKVSSASSTSITIQEIMDNSLRLAVEGMNLTEGSIYLLTPGQGSASLKLAASFGMSPNAIRKMDQENCLIRQVVERGQAILSADLSAEESCSQCLVLGDQTTRTPHSFLGLPMHAQTHLVGVLNVFGAPRQSFTVEEIALIETVADQIAVSIENARLRQQMGAAAIKEERARLGRELHDSVTQEIYSLMLFSETARRASREGKIEQSSHLLDRIFDIAHQALKEMRLMVYDLHPMALEQAGLVEALHGRLDAVEKRAGVAIEFVTTGELEKLSAEVSQELYRMATEALNNATKHAHANHILINLCLEKDTVELTVRDDGCGFDPQAAAEQGGLGIRSMQERSAHLKGQLSIETAPGQGTAIHIRAPLLTNEEGV